MEKDKTEDNIIPLFSKSDHSSEVNKTEFGLTKTDIFESSEEELRVKIKKEILRMVSLYIEAAHLKYDPSEIAEEISDMKKLLDHL